jgi:hypothetical protein
MTAYIKERRVTVYVRAAEGAGVTDVPECWFARCVCVCLLATPTLRFIVVFFCSLISIHRYLSVLLLAGTVCNNCEWDVYLRRGR